METAIKKIEETSLVIIDKSNSIQISNQEELVFAADLLKTIKSMQNNIKDAFVSIIEKAHQAHKEAISQKDKYLNPLLSAEVTVKQKMLAYQQIQERIRQVEERKLQEAARKREEALRAAKEEQERAWREKEEAARKEAERLAAEGKAEEAEKARIEADKAATKAAERAAQAQEIFVPVPVLTSKVEKIAGIATRTIWKFRIVDVDKIPRQYMLPNEKMLGEIARTLKGSLAIEGVEFYPEEIMSSKI